MEVARLVLAVAGLFPVHVSVYLDALGFRLGELMTVSASRGITKMVGTATPLVG